MALTDRSAAALRSGRVLTVRCPNGDTVTACAQAVLRWGRSPWALPSGLEVGRGGATVVGHCGRGAAARAARS